MVAPLGLLQHWQLEPRLAFLNHGSFGACPRPVLEQQTALRQALERSPVEFLARQLEGRLDAAREALAAFVDADPEGIAFMPNATAGVNTFLRAFPLAPGDHLLVTDHAYLAARNAVDAIARERGAVVDVVTLPYPGATREGILEAVLAGVTPKTRLAVLDHVTSQSALVLPIRELVRALTARGVETLVDGAHGPGMVPLSLRELGAAAYAANCHKWVCAPKGAAFLWVAPAWMERVRPLSIGLGASSTRAERSRFRAEFDWQGTADPTPWLCIPEALRFLEVLVDGGAAGLMDHNRLVALAERRALAEVLQTRLPCDDDLVGSMACVELPPISPPASRDPNVPDPLQQELFERHRIEVPVIPFPAGRRYVRLSVQAYNTSEDFERLRTALASRLGS